MQIERMLKVIILLAVTIPQILCVDRKILEECTKELQIDVDPKTGAISKKSNTTCLTKCMYQKINTIDENGKTIIENNHKVLQPFLKTCEDKIKDENPCTRVNEVNECFEDNFDAITKAILKHCVQETKTEFKEDHLVDFEDFSKACFNKCALTVMGVLDDSGDVSFIDLYTSEDYIYKDNVGKVFEQCVEEHKDDDHCVRSMKRITCFMTKLD